jgi:hypothetical protein
MATPISIEPGRQVAGVLPGAVKLCLKATPASQMSFKSGLNQACLAN